MAILLAARRLTHSEIKSVLFASICDTPQWGTRIVSTLSCTALRLLFRPPIIVNASQIAAGRAATQHSLVRCWIVTLMHGRYFTAAARLFAPLWPNENGMKPTFALAQPASWSVAYAKPRARSRKKIRRPVHPLWLLRERLT